MFDITEFNLFVGKRIKEARIAARLSQIKLGEAIGLHGMTAISKMSRIESGVSNIDFSRLVLIAQATGKSLYFFTGDYLQ